jgi:hypothetical protein
MILHELFQFGRFQSFFEIGPGRLVRPVGDVLLDPDVHLRLISYTSIPVNLSSSTEERNHWHQDAHDHRSHQDISRIKLLPIHILVRQVLFRKVLQSLDEIAKLFLILAPVRTDVSEPSSEDGFVLRGDKGRSGFLERVFV